MLERLLIVGLGSIGARHLRLVRSLEPGLQVIAMRRGCDGPAEPGVDHCVTSLADAMRFKPQAALIANPASHHLEVAMPLARAGIHLLVEKPISGSCEGIGELIAACAEAGAVLLVGYNLRFLPSLRRFRELLAEKRIGRTLSVRAEVGQFLPSWRPGVDYRQGISANAKLGGGVLLELSHEIDYLRWLFGDVEWVSAVQRRQSALEIDVDDTAHLVLGFVPESGARPVVASLNMDFIRHDSARTCTAIGETGSLRWDAIEGKVEVFDQGATAWTTLHANAPGRDDSYISQWRHFLDCMAGTAMPLTTGEDGLAVLEIVEAAKASSDAGAVIVLERAGRAIHKPAVSA